uniref:Uncharacterized protein n=1 Tax=Rhizophora mucronata TaxID=61149 RepID=A0A2P2Q3T3_RHIMU
MCCFTEKGNQSVAISSRLLNFLPGPLVTK